MLERKDFVPADRSVRSPWARVLVGAELHPSFAAGGLQGTWGYQDSVKETPGFAISFSSAYKQLSKVLNVCRFQWYFSKTKADKPPGVSEYSLPSVINTGDVKNVQACEGLPLLLTSAKGGSKPLLSATEHISPAQIG